MRVVTALLLGLFLLPSARAQDCTATSEISQTQSNAFGNLISTQGIGQSFTAPCSGVLQNVEVDVQSVDSGPIVGMLLILDGDGGGGDTLGMAPYSLPDVGFQRIAVPSRVRLMAGESYTFFLDAPTSGSGNLQAFNGDPYTEGQSYVGPDAASATGFAADISFKVDLGPPALESIADMVEAYVWANDPTAASYTPASLWSYNVEGGTNTIVRTDVGRYTLTLEDIPSFREDNLGNVQVSTYDSNATCVSGGWDSTPVNIRILCRNTSDEFVDARYTVLFTRADATEFDATYSFIDMAGQSDYEPNPALTYNSAGGSVSAYRYDNNGTVNQVIFRGFPERSAFDVSGHLQATAFATTATGGTARCGLASFGMYETGDLSTDIRCRDLSGAPLVARHSVLFLRGSDTMGGPAVAYAHANQRSEPSYTPPADRAYTSNGGEITAFRNGTGDYAMTFEGLGSTTTAGGAVQVTAFANEGGYCNIFEWGSTAAGDAFVLVDCFDDAGVPADREYTVLYVWPENDVAAVASEVRPNDDVLGIALAGPNPVFRRTELAVTLAEPSAARVGVIDLLGREVAVLLDRRLGAGTTRVGLDASGLQPGVYVARVIAAGQVRTVRFTVVR